MAIALNCPACNRQLRVKDELAGKRGKCPGCGQKLIIPAAPGMVSDSDRKTVANPIEGQSGPSARHGFPRIALRVGSSVGEISVDREGWKWHPPQIGDQFGWGWLRRLIYDAIGSIWLGRVLDDSLAYIVDGTIARDAYGNEIVHEVKRFPQAAEALQTAAKAGFLNAAVDDCLELHRFKIGFQDIGRAMSFREVLVAILPALFFGLVGILVGIYLVLPVWGVSWTCRVFPDSFRQWLVRWYTGASLRSKMVGLAVLWFGGLFAGVTCGVLFFYSIFWPPLFLKLLSKSGDFVLLTKDSRIFYSGYHRVAVQFPNEWIFHKGRFSQYYAILGYERNGGIGSCGVLTARLNEQWIVDLDLRIEPLGWSFRKQLMSKAKLLFGNPQS